MSSVQLALDSDVRAPARTIQQLIHLGIHAKSNPDKAACMMARPARFVTYRELDDESNRATNLLCSLGLKPDDTLGNRAEIR
jgi:acyl-coenzyme A synthetase/AMP-(fatty) acid ligase